MSIAVLSANLGGIDKSLDHVPQSLLFDNFVFNDDNFPPRDKAMTHRLQAKIPKCFGWQLKPGYDTYMWLDGNITLDDTGALKYFADALEGHDIVVLKHPRRPTVWKEGRYIEQGLDEQSKYLVSRYDHEWLKQQMEVINSDPDYTDDLLVCGGVFMYRNTPEVQAMLKEWWYHITRYLIMDQCSFTYVLKKSGLRVNVLPDVFNDCKWLQHKGHNRAR